MRGTVSSGADRTTEIDGLGSPIEGAETADTTSAGAPGCNQQQETKQMSDTDVQYETETTSPAGDGAEAPEVTEADIISRGKGMSPNAVAELPADSPAKQAFEEFKVLEQRRKDAEETANQLREDRNAAIFVLKDTHDIGFSAIAEVVGVTSSAILYTYERAQGKTAKQIREESVRSREAKERFRESDPNRKPVRKQTPEEKALRKRQREELQAFLAQQRESGVDVDDLPEDDDDE
jgi:DNA-directed RNA polymerase specialized sigma24 family protein